MKKNIKKAGILFGIFLVSLAVFFLADQDRMESEETVYTEISEPTLPVVYPQVYGREINCMHGYIQDMKNQAARESITVLPEDRALELRIQQYNNMITDISYEIRSLSLDRLVEQTEVDDWTQEGDDALVTLPIDNVLSKDQPYLLTLTLDTGEKEIHYYTRIIWTDKTYAQDMINLAEEFSKKTMDYNQARDLVTYLETDSAEDNSSLGHVTIRASFDHLTWDGLDVEMAGEPEITLKELDGIMGQIQIKYLVSLTDGQGNTSMVETEDNYTMKWDKQRIYMMNYERYANEIFDADVSQLSGKRILLGITNEQQVSSMASPDSRYIAFKTGGNLWRYDQKDQDFLQVFTFESDSDDGVRSSYDSHDVQILRVREDGSVDFLVYGYMNRGRYEGQNGVVFYTYSQEDNGIHEHFFLPAAESFEQIKEDVSQLSYIGSNEMLYLLLNGTVYGIDLNSNESMAVAHGLSQGTFAVSQDGSRLAWLEGGDIYRTDKLQLMDMDTAQKQEISAGEGEYVRVLGFVGGDLVYGLARENDGWIENGRLKDFPMYGVYIMGEDMEVVSSYQTEGLYISNVRVDEGRIHMDRLVKTSDQNYVFQNQDTIVCNEEIETDSMEGIGWYASQDKGRVYFVETKDSIQTASVSIQRPSQYFFENTGVMEAGENGADQDVTMFYAYGGGHYIGASRSFQQALNMAYAQMGSVVNQDQYLIWDRVNRAPIVNIKDPVSMADQLISKMENLEEGSVSEEGLMVIDARGCSLNQILYFIDKGYPIIAYIGENSYVLLSGYDQYNVTVFDPVTQQSQKMGLNDANAYFEALENDFVCGRIIQ